MSLYDKASLALIPSGYKAGTTDNLYSVLPANGDGDFNATRGSSATRVNKDGFIESVVANTPRLNYPLIDGVVQSCPALLLEPSRTNVIVRSEEFNTWATASGTTVSTNQSISPDGNQTADLVQADGTNAFSRIYNNISLTSGNNYVYSVFVKKSGSHDFASIRLQGTDVGGAGQTGSTYTFTFSTETLSYEGGGTATSTFVENYGSGWYRIGIELTNSTITSYLIYPRFNISEAGQVLVWGAQLEEGSYETSYIPTSGSTVTRSADECNSAGTSAEFNDSEGVLFVEFAALANDLTHRRIAISDGTTGDFVYVSFDTYSNRILANANGKIMVYTVSDETQFQKAAVYYNATAPKLYVNGFLRETETAMTAITGLNELAFDNGGGGNDFYGKTKQLMTFNQALTDSELEQITSWRSFGEMAKGQLYTIE